MPRTNYPKAGDWGRCASCPQWKAKRAASMGECRLMPWPSAMKKAKHEWCGQHPVRLEWVKFQLAGEPHPMGEVDPADVFGED